MTQIARRSARAPLASRSTRAAADAGAVLGWLCIVFGIGSLLGFLVDRAVRVELKLAHLGARIEALEGRASDLATQEGNKTR